MPPSSGVRSARLPLLEYLPPTMRGRSHALDALNLNAVFRLLVEWSQSRDWTSSIATALASQRHCCGAAGMIAADATARATPDGLTLMLATDGAIVAIPFLQEKCPTTP